MGCRRGAEVQSRDAVDRPRRYPTPDDFEEALWPTQGGDERAYAHLVETWVRKLGPCQVLIVELDPDDPPKRTRYFVTSRVNDTLEQVVGHLAQRWIIEVPFADCEELMGSDHYQMRSTRAIVRFWASGLCLHRFLDELRAVHLQTCGRRLTRGRARQRVREAHRAQLLNWLFDQVRAGVARDQIQEALQPAMRL